MLLQRALAERVAGKSCKVVGLMSGTSLDGLDIVLVSLRGSGPTLQIESIDKFETIPLDCAVRGMIQQLLQCYGPQSAPSHSNTPHPLELVCKLNAAWSRFVGEAVNAFLATAAVAADDTESGDGERPKNFDCNRSIVVGSHGQTLWHEGHHAPPYSTLQLGDGEILAAVCGRVVVCNFRNSDVGVGGCGAPLVPYTDRILAAAVYRWFCHTYRGGVVQAPANDRCAAVALQNLGGIGNVSCVHVRSATAPASSSTLPTADGSSSDPTSGDDVPPLLAFDTGPANAILNEIVEVAFGFYQSDPTFQSRCWSLMPSSLAATPCDWNGCFSSLGSVHEDWLREWWTVHEAFLDASPPKSTGREVFGSEFVQRHCVASIGIPRGWSKGMPNTHLGAAASDATVDAFFDLCRTAVVFTARTIAHNYQRHLPAFPSIVALSGGGAWNPTMVAAITEALHASTSSGTVGGEDGGGVGSVALPIVVPLSHTMGTTSGGDLLASTPAGTAGPSTPSVDDAKEAIAFAILAHEKLNQVAGVFNPSSNVECGTNVTTATGAKRGAVLGQISVPS